MKASEFIKKFGWEVAKDIVKNCPPMGFLSNPFIKDNGACVRVLTKPSDFEVKLLDDLKRLVESHELVQVGLPELKKAMFSDSKDLEYVKNWILTVSDKLLTEKGVELKKAILDVESCL